MTAVPPAAAFAAAVAANDGSLSARDIVTLAAEIWIIAAGLFAIAAAAVALGGAMRGYRHSDRELAGAIAATIFVLVWFPRLLAARRLAGFGVGIAVAGVIEWALLLASAAAILTAASGRRLWRRAAATGAAAALASLALTAACAWFEPARSREQPAREVLGALRAAPRASPRALVLAVDALDWQVTADLIRAGALPHIEALLARSVGYRLDNRGLALSPQIWTLAYTGTDASWPIGGFVRWRFAGVGRRVAWLPMWQGRPAAMADDLLGATERLGLWRAEPVRSDQIPRAPAWRVAAAAGRRVLVADPFPFANAPESLRGVWIGSADDTGVVYRDGIRQARFDAADRAAVMARLLADERPDLAVYYSHAVDNASHEAWGFDVFRPAQARAAQVAEAYRRMDAEVGLLVDAAGDASIVLVSDHGFEMSAYEHRTSPDGVLALAGAGAAGYAGAADITALAPTMLALAGVPVPRDMADPVPAAIAGVRRCDCPAPAARFIEGGLVDRDRAERLRAVGYFAR